MREAFDVTGGGDDAVLDAAETTAEGVNPKTGLEYLLPARREDACAIAAARLDLVITSETAPEGSQRPVGLRDMDILRLDLGLGTRVLHLSLMDVSIWETPDLRVHFDPGASQFSWVFA